MAEQTFNEFTKQARIEFVNYINSLEWNNELRTKCEDLLIAYDQMKAKCDGIEDSNENSGLHLQRVSFSEERAEVCDNFRQGKLFAHICANCGDDKIYHI